MKQTVTKKDIVISRLNWQRNLVRWQISHHLITLLLLICGIGFLSGCDQKQTHDWAEYVNPFIGTVRGSGSTYPGAQLPFGMLAFSPHTLERNHGSGYDYTSDKIRGFGLVHISGVGCEAVCELPFMPVTGDLASSPVMDKNTYSSLYKHDTETASPAYYGVTLDDYGVDVELSASVRSGIAKFNYPTSDSAHLVFDPGASANGLRDGVIKIDPQQQKISGWIKGGGFCGVNASDYVIYYTVVFDTPFKEYGVWQSEQKKTGTQKIEGKDIAAYVSFESNSPRVVTMKTGISYVSLANAELNLQIEIPDWDFQNVCSAGRDEWNKVLNKVQVEGGTLDDKTIFYTALYHSLMLPNIFEDVNGQYIGMDNKIKNVESGHHIYSTFSGWDTYRTQAQLWGLLYPQVASDFCQTLLETSRQTERDGGGGLPLWSMFNDETTIMSGYPASPFIASAYAFGARDFDIEALTKVMIDSGRETRYWGRNNHHTWQHLEDYKKHGYYPYDCGIHCPISQNVEYAVADYSIAQMCKAIDDMDNYQYFLKRSQSVFNLMHPTEKYLWARLKDGTWKKDFNPFTGDGCQEGTSTHYTWGIPYSLDRLISEIGGSDVAEKRLDQLMSKIAMGYDYGNPNYLAGNEPCFGVVPVYNWINRPWKTQKQMRRVIDASFSNDAKGIPGDDDSGAMSAWYLFAAMGLYPEIPGVGGFAVTGTLFPKMTIILDSGQEIVINAENAGQNAPYIQSMSINGKSSEATWLSLDQLMKKKNNTINFIMSDQPNKSWGQDYQMPSFDN